jgi:excisionase family DNA binding protein
MPVINTDKHLSTVEFAEALGLSPQSVQRYCWTGTISAKKIGRDWLIPVSEVERYRRENLNRRGRPSSSS